MTGEEWEKASLVALNGCRSLFKPKEVLVICDFIRTATEDMKTAEAKAKAPVQQLEGPNGAGAADLGDSPQKKGGDDSAVV